MPVAGADHTLQIAADLAEAEAEAEKKFNSVEDGADQGSSDDEDEEEEEARYERKQVWSLIYSNFGVETTFLVP